MRDVRRRFDLAAAAGDHGEFVQSVTRDGLFARLEPMQLTAATVLDLGSAGGASMHGLKRRFRSARIVAVDLSLPMLRAARRRARWYARPSLLVADARALPFRDGCVDVVFSNLLLPWIDEPAAVFAEVSRVLGKNGLFAFATLGPDSLAELGEAWRRVDAGAHVMTFPDMHDIGDALLRAGLRDPVLDVDRLRLNYDSAEALCRDLTAAGARNSLRHRRRTLTGKRRVGAFREALFGAVGDRALTLELELVYGHCWGRGDHPARRDVHIDAGSIPLRRR